MAKGGSGSQYDPAKLGNTLGNKLTSYVNSSAPVFNKSLYTGQGATTQGALGNILSGANPGGFSGHIGDTIGEFGDIASGKRFGMDDPGYAQLRSKLGQDTLTGVNSIFAGSGRFGSGSHVDTATTSLGNVLAGLDYGNFQNDQQRQFGAADRMAGLYENSQRPGQTRLAVGQMQDADALAQRQAEFEQFDRTQNANYNRFKELLAAFTGSQEAAGMAEEPGFLQMLLGGIGTGLGIAAR